MGTQEIEMIRITVEQNRTLGEMISRSRKPDGHLNLATLHVDMVEHFGYRWTKTWFTGEPIEVVS